MRGIHDPQNPYWSEYQPWDFWVYEHLVKSGYDPRYAASLWQDSQSMFWESIVVPVDQDGFLVPLLYAEQVHLERDADPGGEHEVFAGYVIAQGVMPPQRLSGEQYACSALKASMLPTVPRWLTERHIHWAMLWTDGLVITRERASSRGGRQPLEPHYEYCLYDKDGYLKKEVVGVHWWEVFWQDCLELESLYREEHGDSFTVQESNGLIRFLQFEEETGYSVLDVRNYDGRPVEEVEDAYTRSRLQFDKLSPAELLELQRMQVSQQGRAV